MEIANLSDSEIDELILKLQEETQKRNLKWSIHRLSINKKVEIKHKECHDFAKCCGCKDKMICSDCVIPFTKSDKIIEPYI